MCVQRQDGHLVLRSNTTGSSILLGNQSSLKTGSPCLRQLRMAAGFLIPNRQSWPCVKDHPTAWLLSRLKTYLVSLRVCGRWEYGIFPFAFHWNIVVMDPSCRNVGMIFPQTSSAFFAVSAVFKTSWPQHDLMCLWRLPVDPASFVSRKHCTNPLHRSLQHLNSWAWRPPFSTIVGIGLKNA